MVAHSLLIESYASIVNSFPRAPHFLRHCRRMYLESIEMGRPRGALQRKLGNHIVLEMLSFQRQDRDRR